MRGQPIMIDWPDLDELESVPEYREAGKKTFRSSVSHSLFPDPYDVLEHYADSNNIEFPNWLVEEEKIRERDPEYWEDFDYALKALDRRTKEQYTEVGR